MNYYAFEERLAEGTRVHRTEGVLALQRAETMKVDACLPKPACAPWRSVRVHTPIDRSLGATGYDQRDSFRVLIRQIAQKHRIPVSRTSVVWRTCIVAGLYGYIRVYRGVGTAAEKRLFERVLKTSSLFPFSSVGAG